MANVSMGQHFEDFAQSLVASGSYNNISKVVRDAMRLLEEEQQLKALRLQTLKGEIQKGLDSGSAGPLDIDEIKAKARKLYEMRKTSGE